MKTGEITHKTNAFHQEKWGIERRMKQCPNKDIKDQATLLRQLKVEEKVFKACELYFKDQELQLKDFRWGRCFLLLLLFFLIEGKVCQYITAG